MRKCSGVSGSPQIHSMLSHWPSLCLYSFSLEYPVCICRIWQKLFLLGISRNFFKSTVKPVKIVYLKCLSLHFNKKAQAGKDQEKAQSEKDSHSKNRGGKKPN